MIPDESTMPGKEQVTLVGGPCDGQRVAPFTGALHVPLSQGRRAHFGEHVDAVAIYHLGITGTKAHFVNPTKERK